MANILNSQEAAVELRNSKRHLESPDYDAIKEFREFNEITIKQIYKDRTLQSFTDQTVQISEYLFYLALGRITRPEDWAEIGQLVIDQLNIRMQDYGVELPLEYDPLQIYFEVCKDTKISGQYIEEYKSIGIAMPPWNYVDKFASPFSHELIEYLTYRTDKQNGISPRGEDDRSGVMNWAR